MLGKKRLQPIIEGITIEQIEALQKETGIKNASEIIRVAVKKYYDWEIEGYKDRSLELIKELKKDIASLNMQKK